MALDISYDLTTADGQNPNVLAQIIQARTKELGETTQNACVAVAINILKSLRAQTKVAKPNETPHITMENVDGSFTPSWKGVKGGKPRPCLRAGKDGAEITDAKVIWYVPKYVKGQVWHAYHVVDHVGVDKKYEYLIVALSEKDAFKKVCQIHRNRIKRHKGLAKVALGIAMHKVYEGQGGGSASPNVQSIANQNVETRIASGGFGSGYTSIYVHDKLDYATAALKNGYASVSDSIRNAAAKMIGYLQKKIDNNNSDIMKSLLFAKDEMMRVV